MFDMRKIDKDEIRDLLNHSLIRYTHIDHFLKCGIKKCNNQTICIVKSATNYTESIVTSLFPICNFHFKELFGERCEICKNRENCKIIKNESEYIWIKEVN
jgi:hypothetical protein